MTQEIMITDAMRARDELEGLLISLRSQFGAVLYLMGEEYTSPEQDELFTWLSDLKTQVQKAEELIPRLLQAPA